MWILVLVLLWELLGGPRKKAMRENRKVEFVAVVSVDESDIITGTQPILSRFLGKPLHELAQYIERTTGAYQKDQAAVPAR